MLFLKIVGSIVIVIVLIVIIRKIIQSASSYDPYQGRPMEQQCLNCYKYFDVKTYDRCPYCGWG